MKGKFTLIMSLRVGRKTDRNRAHLVIALPLYHVWFEGVTNDLHIQFDGFEGINILPSDNADGEEWEIPRDAVMFREWLKEMNVEQGGPPLGRNTIVTSFSNTIEMRERGDAKLFPPRETLKDLIDHWTSPNKPNLNHNLNQ